jgi:hypothetical protein
MTASRIVPVKGPGKPMLKTGWRLVMGASLLLLVQVRAEEGPRCWTLAEAAWCTPPPIRSPDKFVQVRRTYRESGQQEAQISSGAHLIL